MEINGFKQPELVTLLDKHFDGESSRYDITPSKNYLTAMQLNRSETKNLNYEELRPKKIYALKFTTTDIQAGIQETSYSLFLDRKMAETYYYQNTPKDNLVLNHQVQHGIIISGDINNDLLARLQMAPKDFNSMLVVSTMQADSFTNTQKQQIEQASKIAEKVFNEIPLKNEYAFNTLPRGAQQDLYKYYELTHKQNPKIIHTDAWAIQDKKEAIKANEPYVYVGLIHSKDGSTPSIAYTNEREYLNAIEQGLKNNPQNIGYETLSQNPQLHKQVDDLVYKFYGLSNPNPIEYYTQQGRTPLNLYDSNHHEISIMDLAKQMGFTYQGKTTSDDIIMQQDFHPIENGQKQTAIISLEIRNAENPMFNTVTVNYSYLDEKNNPIARDTDFHLSFKDFVALTKSLNSEEILKTMENEKETIRQIERFETIGTILYKDTNEKINYTDADKYLLALHDALDTQPHNIKYETLSKDPEILQKVDEIIYGFFNMEPPKQKTSNDQPQYNVETQPIESFHYETSSVYHKDYLLYGLQNKFKLDTDTVAKFATFMEAAHPINKNHNDNSADIVVFPYVKVDNEYNLKGHIQSTMSSQREPLGEKLTDHTNVPIGYERYTNDQTIPVTPYTTTASINGGIWMATEAQSPKSVKDVFMFNSAIDAMSFYEIHRNSINLKNTALVSVGNLARENQIYGLVERFPEAQLHAAFQNTLLGQLSTITAASMASIGPVKFKTNESKHTIEFTTYYDKFSLPINDINLQNFKEHAHVKDKSILYDLNKDLKIHYPLGRTYNEDLVQSKQLEKQEQGQKMKI